jgi:hypothetical protein
MAKPKKTRLRVPIGSPKTGETVADLLQEARNAAREGITGLSWAIGRVKETLQAAEAYDPKLASHLSYLSEGAVKVMGELRQLDKHDLKGAEDMTEAEEEELARAYLADLPAGKREAFAQYLAELAGADRGALS